MNLKRSFWRCSNHKYHNKKNYGSHFKLIYVCFMIHRQRKTLQIQYLKWNWKKNEKKQSFWPCNIGSACCVRCKIPRFIHILPEWRRCSTCNHINRFWKLYTRLMEYNNNCDCVFWMCLFSSMQPQQAFKLKKKKNSFFNKLVYETRNNELIQSLDSNGKIYVYGR